MPCDFPENTSIEINHGNKIKAGIKEKLPSKSTLEIRSVVVFLPFSIYFCWRVFRQIIVTNHQQTESNKLDPTYTQNIPKLHVESEVCWLVQYLPWDVITKEKSWADWKTWRILCFTIHFNSLISRRLSLPRDVWVVIMKSTVRQMRLVRKRYSLHWLKAAWSVKTQKE